LVLRLSTEGVQPWADFFFFLSGEEVSDFFFKMLAGVLLREERRRSCGSFVGEAMVARLLEHLDLAGGESISISCGEGMVNIEFNW
jgi:hypothetical protein